MIWIIVLTSLLSSILTATVMWLIIRVLFKKYRQQMEQELDIYTERVSQQIETSVKKGIVEGIQSLPSVDVLRGTTRTMAKTGAELMGGGFNTIFGKRGAGTRPPGSESGDKD